MISREQDRLQALTENLANSSMPGFKKLVVGEMTFDTLLNQSVDYYMNQNEKGRYDPVFVDYTAGATKITDRPLDFAINGEGFFTVEKNGQQLYTRNGQFKLSSAGVLQNMNGLPVQGMNGAITLPPETNLNQLIAGPDGSIRDADNNILGQIKVVKIDDLTSLNRAGTTLYSVPEGTATQDAQPGEYEVEHKALECSNTSIYDEMAEMISCMRAYEANQKMVKAHDENQEKMITTFRA